MPKFFNASGPCVPEKHYMIDVGERFGNIQRQIDDERYFILHAPRQTGKTTIARIVADARVPVHTFDLERSADRAALSTPEQTLSALAGLVIIDEVQRMPELFGILRPLVDRDPAPATYLLLGSASPDLVKGVSETLAGRTLFAPVPGFSLEEVGTENQDSLWLRGAFPRSWLAPSDPASVRWREAFVTTFLERDIPQEQAEAIGSPMRRYELRLRYFAHDRREAEALTTRLLGLGDPVQEFTIAPVSLRDVYYLIMEGQLSRRRS